MSGQSRSADLEAERYALGGMLISSDTISEVLDVLEVEHFTDESHRQIYAAIRELFEGGSAAIDAAGLLKMLNSHTDFDQFGGAEYVMRIVRSVPLPAYAVHYANIVRGA